MTSVNLPEECALNIYFTVMIKNLILSTLGQTGTHQSGAPNVNFWKISVRKTIWDIEFSEQILKKIHKPTPVGGPIISGCDGPTERISAFVDHLIQPIAQKQASYLKDTTDFLNFIEKTKLHNQPLHEHTPGGGYYHCMRSIRRILWGKPSHSYQVFKRNAKSDSTRKLVPIQWKRLPPNSWNSHGDENGRSFC